MIQIICHLFLAAMAKKSIEQIAAEEALGLFESGPSASQPSIPFKPEHLAVILGQCNMSLERAKAHIILGQRNTLQRKSHE